MSSGGGAGAYFPPRTDDGEIVDDEGGGYPNVDSDGYAVICAGCAAVFPGPVQREQIVPAPESLYGEGAVHYVCDETCARLAALVDEPHVTNACGCDPPHPDPDRKAQR